MPYPGLLYPEPLPLRQATAELASEWSVIARVLGSHNLLEHHQLSSIHYIVFHVRSAPQPCQGLMSEFLNHRDLVSHCGFLVLISPITDKAELLSIHFCVKYVFIHSFPSFPPIGIMISVCSCDQKYCLTNVPKLEHLKTPPACMHSNGSLGGLKWGRSELGLRGGSCQASARHARSGCRLCIGSGVLTCVLSRACSEGEKGNSARSVNGGCCTAVGLGLVVSTHFKPWLPLYLPIAKQVLGQTQGKRIWSKWSHSKSEDVTLNTRRVENSG